MKTSPPLPQIIRLQSPRPIGRVLLLVALLLCAVLNTSHAADDKKADREARRAEQLQQRLQQQQATFETEKTDLQKQIADAKAASDALRLANQKTSSDLEQSTEQRNKLQKTVADLTRQLADAKKAAEASVAENQQQMTRFSKAREQERVVQNARFDATSTALNACTAKNQRLLSVAHQLLQRYQDKNVLDALRQQEPVLGFKDVETFNEVQDYRGQVDALGVETAVPAKPVQ
jgi:DNA repair exonuclease SbcCD ATPase subunit